MSLLKNEIFAHINNNMIIAKSATNIEIEIISRYLLPSSVFFKTSQATTAQREIYKIIIIFILLRCSQLHAQFLENLHDQEALLV